MCEEELDGLDLVMLFLLRLGDFIDFLSVVAVGLAVVFSLIGAVVGFSRRQLFTGFFE